MSSATFTLPDLGEGLTEAAIVSWRVAEGDVVAVDQVVVEVETAKAAVELPSPFAGRIERLHAGEGDIVAVSAPLVSVDTGTEEAADSGPILVGYGTPAEAPAAAAAPAAAPARKARTPVASPVVRRLARDAGIDLAGVTGTGDGGLVTRRDVDAAITARAKPGEDTYSRAHREIPDATCWIETDVGPLLAHLEHLVADPVLPDIGLTALFAKACVDALVEMPVLNAVYDAQRGGLVPGNGVHLGVAAQGTTGLVVPVVHDAHTKTLRQLSAALDRLFARARQGGLNLTETRGSTFTVNNFGPLGVDGAVPIVNHPEVGILGIGRIATRPWVVDDEVRPRPTARIGLTFDHRACDGATAAGFLRAVVARIEQPESLHPDR